MIRSVLKDSKTPNPIPLKRGTHAHAHALHHQKEDKNIKMSGLCLPGATVEVSFTEAGTFRVRKV